MDFKLSFNDLCSFIDTYRNNYRKFNKSLSVAFKNHKDFLKDEIKISNLISKTIELFNHFETLVLSDLRFNNENISTFNF